jgi:hypothetical protein
MSDNSDPKPPFNPDDMMRLMQTVEALVHISDDHGLGMDGLQRMLACNVVLLHAMGDAALQVMEAAATLVHTTERTAAEAARKANPDSDTYQCAFQALMASDPNDRRLKVFVLTNHRATEESISTLLAKANAAANAAGSEE